MFVENVVPWLDYELYNPKFHSWQGQEVFFFFKMPRLALGPHPASYSMGTGVLSCE
jgi:hypothetical protein